MPTGTYELTNKNAPELCTLDRLSIRRPPLTQRTTTDRRDTAYCVASTKTERRASVDLKTAQKIFLERTSLTGIEGRLTTPLKIVCL